jgi:hypothetical protein
MGGLVSAGLGVLALGPARATAQGAAGLSGPPALWRFQIGVGGTWYDNTRFTASDRQSSWSTNARASLSHTRRFRTGSFSLSGFGGKIYYPEIPELDQWMYGGSVGLGWSPSRRSQLTLSQTYARSNTRQLPSLDEEGLPVPTTGVDTATSGLGFSQRLTRRTSLEMNGSFTWRRYDGRDLVGGEQLHASAGLARALGETSALTLAYGLSQSWIEGRTRRVHIATLGARRRPDRGVGLEASGGLAYFEDLQQYHPTGSAGLSASGRRTSFSLRYFRDFGMAFGYGRQTIADRVSASLGWTPVQRLTFSVGYGYGYRRDPADEDFRVQSHVASAGFSWAITQGLGFAARYAWEQSQTEGFPKVRGGHATAALSYGVDWR